MFWKRRGKPEPSEYQENRIDALAKNLQREGRIDALESELAKFDPSKLMGAEEESWYHLRGIVPFRQGNRQLAFDLFQDGLKHCPESAILRFALGQEHEFLGETEEMIKCFDVAVFPRVPAKYALAEARYSYLWNRFDKGWAFVEALMPVYYRLKVLDTTFLHIRGLPFFEQTWAYLAAFSQLDGDFQRLAKLTKKAEAECSDQDFAYLRAGLEGCMSGDFSALKAKLRSSIQYMGKINGPCGYHNLRLNIILAQETKDIEEANQLLDSVTLNANDFPWLDDMRLLAKCQLARRKGNNALECELRSRFLVRQPLLFEPDHAFNFNLLSYQETLKQDFQSTRGAGRK